METILNNHAHRHRVHQPLILHGPRGTGKTTLILERFMESWNKGPHVTGYIDFGSSVKGNHPSNGNSFPWGSWSNCEKPELNTLKNDLESCLEKMAANGVKLGVIGSSEVFRTLKKWHCLDTVLEKIIGVDKGVVGSKRGLSRKVNTLGLWDKAIRVLSVRLSAEEKDGVLGVRGKGGDLSVEEGLYYKEGIVALRLAKEVIRVQQGFRANAVKHLNETGGFSRSLANSATDWPFLLLELLSGAAQADYFQPKLVINNIEVLKHAALVDDSSVSAPMYHDSLIWRIIALGANEMCLPVIFVTSDSYYSYSAYMDFGFPDIFISRETFGWTPQQAKVHMVPDYFSQPEWDLIVEVLGPNARHLFEIYALKQSSYYQALMSDKESTFEDIIDAYLAYLQVTVVNPAMDRALSLLQKFALDAQKGKIPKDKLRFGAPWRYPPSKDDPSLRSEWAKLQLMDFIQCLVNAEFGLNYFADCSLEIFDDPSVNAMIEVGLLYVQRDPSFFRPISRAIQRCLVRWLVQERIKMGYKDSVLFQWHRVVRGRSYRHLMLQVGNK
nr:embryo defective protein [Tanacetum cinerariifolium]